MKNSKRLLALAVAAACGAPMAAYATNGMNLEGYGPIATGMGGASMAYDNGTAAMANNVATLGLMDEGSRFDIALGSLSPDITSAAYAQKSKATSFLMPAMGWAKKSGQLTYGAGVFAQGGMGTEYNVTLPDGSAGKDRSEVGVGRFIVPLVYNVNEALTVGGSLDFVWATMDLQMTAPAAMLGPMVTGGTFAAAMPSMIHAGTPDAAGRFDFSDNNDFCGKAQGNGFAAKLGMTYKVSPALTFGFNYHGKTSMSDLETGTSGATLTFYNVDVDPSPGITIADVALSGKVKVKNFQWPETFALGMAFQASDALMVVADVKQIQWSGVMKDFKMTFIADGNNGPMSGGTLDVTMPQEWKDQTVLQIGAAYKFNAALTGRVGLNMASNPVPDTYVNPLFPAIVKDHLTLGFGYDFNQAQAVNFSYTYAPEVKVNNPTTGEIKHSQTNWQLMYSHRF